MPEQSPERTDTTLAVLSPLSAAAGREIPITAPVSLIGQGPRNDIVLDDDTVSTSHARLEYLAGSWLLTDLESKNGTYIHGVRLAANVPTPVPQGASVAFGALKLGFRGIEGVDAPQPRAARSPAATKSGVRPRFRLPVWLFVLILLVLAALVFSYIQFEGPPPTEVVPDAIGAMREIVLTQNAA